MIRSFFPRDRDKLYTQRTQPAALAISLALAACGNHEARSVISVQTPLVSSPAVESPIPVPRIETETETPAATAELGSTIFATGTAPPILATPVQNALDTTEALPNSQAIRSMAQIYLRDANENIIITNGRRAIIPARLYRNGIYIRDAFFTAVGLADRDLLAENLHFFEENQNPATGQVPSAVPFNPEDRSLVPQDDESSLLFIIWSGMLARDGIPTDRGRVEQAYRFVQAHISDGFYVSASGPFRYWADTVSPERPERIAYNQGFYALSLRMLKEVGVGNISDEQIEQARANYRSFYNPNLGYVTLGKDSSFANAQDLSALLPEFFSRYLFDEPMLADEQVLSTVNHHLKTGAVRFDNGRLAGIKVISSAEGGFLPAEHFLLPEQNQPGNYHNGAYWPMPTLVELSLAFRISPQRRYQEAIAELLKAEMGENPSAKEYLVLSPGDIGYFDPDRSIHAWNALAYRALLWARLA